MGNGERLVKQHGHEIRYVVEFFARRLKVIRA